MSTDLAVGELITAVQQLLHTADGDDHAAVAAFHQLVDTHGTAVMGAALAAAAPEERADRHPSR